MKRKTIFFNGKHYNCCETREIAHTCRYTSKVLIPSSAYILAKLNAHSYPML